MMRTRTTRRGAALLLVLATLVLTTVSCAIAADCAAMLTATRRADHATRIADDLLRAAEAPIEHWLAHTAPTAVLSPEADEPRFEVMRDAVPVGKFEAQITITAFDQLGMVPNASLDTAAALGSLFPPEVAQLVSSLKSASDAPFGLDAIQQRALKSGRAVYPGASSSEPAQALGAILATHNPRAVNVNTAPRNLLEAAMRVAGRGGLESVLAARSRREPFSIASSTARSSQQTIALTARSDVWSFRIDIRVGPVMRSWWCVYQSNEYVQRLVIPE